MSSDLAISVNSLSKSYHIYENPRDRLKQMVVPRISKLLGYSHPVYYRDFWALQDVSFRVSKGETVGILGKNGSGKSTLLQLICGTLNPTAGSVDINGRVAALLELGAGFNPEFTGKENVYLNASILGLSEHEIDERYESIVRFADIGDFVNYPVKTYSSGMFVRLAFAVQAQIDPEILVVDEALAVGDARFQSKCFNRLQELKENGTSILLVTHSTEQVVTHCDRAILLDGGRKQEDGLPRQIVNKYLDLLYGNGPRSAPSPKSRAPTKPPVNKGVDLNDELEIVKIQVPDFYSGDEEKFGMRNTYNEHEHRWGDGIVEIIDYCVVRNNDFYPTEFKSGDHITVYLRVRFLQDVIRPICGFTLKTKEGVTLYGTNTEMGAVDGDFAEGLEGKTCIISFEVDLNVGGGDYFLSVGVASRNVEGEVFPHDRRYDAIHLHVQQGKGFFGLSDLDATMVVYP